ncbi:MAG: hypothetical protein A2075_06360 [Geobacteraceae bacterium GWC2_58_44]|nr:MAG: hypothetical protein A2075_06360 [Geobacteraceae bacterium GWC2_58_44]
MYRITTLYFLCVSAPQRLCVESYLLKVIRLKLPYLFKPNMVKLSRKEHDDIRALTSGPPSSGSIETATMT